MTEDTLETVLKFPCRIDIKAMGLNHDEFESLVCKIVRGHLPEGENMLVKNRASQGGKYRSVTVSVTATSREQMDKIYHELTAHESVLWAL